MTATAVRWRMAAIGLLAAGVTAAIYLTDEAMRLQVSGGGGGW